MYFKTVMKFSSNSRSPNFYGISVHLLKGIIEGILQSVTMLVIECLSTRTFQDALKIAE